MKPLVTIEKASFYYPRAPRPALLNVDLTLYRGEILGLLGATGAGKTTLCLALNGIVPQFHGGRFFGRVEVEGLDTVDHPIHTLAARVAMVFQDPETQLLTASVENEVAFALENLRLPHAEIRRRVDESLAAVDLASLASKHPHELSGGQQQRLAIAAALAVQPALIVMDEPTSQLDPLSVADVFHLIRDLNRRLGTTFLVTGHASEEMAETVHRVAVLSRGRLVATGKPEAIYNDTPLLHQERLRPPEVTTTFSLLADRGLGRRPAPVLLPAGLAALTHFPGGKPLREAMESPSPRSEVPVLELRDVSFAYADGTRALQGINLQLRRREYVVILGQNGAGKSTLLRHFLKLQQPTEGQVLIDGTPLDQHSVPELAQRIGYVPQNPDRQLFNSTVEDEVAFSLRPLPLSAEQKAHRVQEALRALQLEDYRRLHPFSLSKGDRARVVIAAALVLQPEILIFDEPTTGQDEAGARAILDLTRSLHEQGRTVVVVTHHLYLMPGYAQRAVVMGQGRLLLDASLREAYHAGEVLKQTRLRVTQAVALAQAVHPENRAVTPSEVAANFEPLLAP